jgi:hypothetical protein
LRTQNPPLLQFKPKPTFFTFTSKIDLRCRSAESINNSSSLKFDGFVKSPSAALRFTFVVAAYLLSRPHSSGFARLAHEAFYFAIPILTFYEMVKFNFLL